MSIKVLEVSGLDYAVQEAIALSGNEGYVSDSYWTYIENPETLNRAKFEFFLGDKDKQLIMGLPDSLRNLVTSLIRVYYELPTKHIDNLSYCVLEALADDFSYELVSQLPYKELITGVE